LLKGPESDYESGWFMAVPSVFSSSLDIKINCGTNNPGWTQSGCFAFADHDVIYDVPPHKRKWADDLYHVRIGIQIKSASPAGQGSSGRVVFDYFVHDGEGTSVEMRGTSVMTQDEFVRFLIVGPEYEIKERINMPLELDLG
jgi:hypothetical protein